VAVIAVLTNLPDSESAFNLRASSWRFGLAACANRALPRHSFYRWEGRDEQATEYPVLIKSTPERYPELKAPSAAATLRLPEIIAWPVDAGLPAYLEWVEREVSQP
jgi:periplasmic divalent cation tolerance protein